MLTSYSTKKSKSDLIDKEYSNVVVEHISYTPASGSFLLYVAIVPRVSILSTDSAGVVVVITDPLLTDENRISTDLVNADTYSYMQSYKNDVKIGIQLL